MPQSIIGLQLVSNAVILERAASDAVKAARGVQADDDLPETGRRWLASKYLEEADVALDRAIALRMRASSPEASMEESIA